MTSDTNQAGDQQPARPQRDGRTPAGLVAALATALLISTAAGLPSRSQGVERARSLPDISGLVWLEEDLFIGVHDAKPSPGQPQLPRISLVRLPQSNGKGVSGEPLDLPVPNDGAPISDLESASRLPGTQSFLLAESGQEGRQARRLFLASYRNGRVTLDAQAPWPVPVTNVEATEVVEVGGQLLFVFAERADGRGQTRLRWAPMFLNPLRFGAFRQVTYRGLDPVGDGARPIVALAAAADGTLYGASSFDPGNDGGPFRSVVWQIGRITADADGQPRLELSPARRLATLDGLKVESLAVRESTQDGTQLFIGTDDENYGGILRPLPVRLTTDRPPAAR